MPEHLDHPEIYSRRVLLVATGLSPQIVTETLYALPIEWNPAWIPTEIQVVTTQRGAEIALETLLSSNPGWFRRLRDDYGLPEIEFGAKNVHVVSLRACRSMTF
jgi:CRISPR-associated protein (TIGR02584 family)